MHTDELKRKLEELDNGDNLEIKVIMRQSMGSLEPGGMIIVERIKTPDYIQIVRVIDRLTNDIRGKLK